MTKNYSNLQFVKNQHDTYLGFQTYKVWYFASFILVLGPKIEILYFAPPGIVKKQFRPPPRGGEFENPEAEPRGILFD